MVNTGGSCQSRALLYNRVSWTADTLVRENFSGDGNLLNFAEAHESDHLLIDDRYVIASRGHIYSMPLEATDFSEEYLNSTDARPKYN